MLAYCLARAVHAQFDSKDIFVYFYTINSFGTVLRRQDVRCKILVLHQISWEVADWCEIFPDITWVCSWEFLTAKKAAQWWHCIWTWGLCEAEFVKLKQRGCLLSPEHIKVISKSAKTKTTATGELVKIRWERCHNGPRYQEVLFHVPTQNTSPSARFDVHLHHFNPGSSEDVFFPPTPVYCLSVTHPVPWKLVQVIIANISQGTCSLWYLLHRCTDARI